MKKKKKLRKLGIISLVIIDLIVAVCFFLTYGPYSYFRDFLVTTAMTTMTHKYLARTFYSEETINKILANNTIESFTEGTDTSKIVIGGEEKKEYASEYERQILERDKDQA